jgi:hypothetical protein
LPPSSACDPARVLFQRCELEAVSIIGIGGALRLFGRLLRTATLQ